MGAKAEIHHLMNRLTHEGMAVIMVSSELPEVLGMSDRVAVMREGRIAAFFDKEEATSEKIMLAAAGGSGRLNWRRHGNLAVRAALLAVLASRDGVLSTSNIANVIGQASSRARAVGMTSLSPPAA